MKTLFEDIKLSRRNDPQTSKDAAKKIVDTGKLGQQQQDVYELLKMFWGCTAKQLAATSYAIKKKYTQFTFCRRLPELKDKNLAYTNGIRNGERIWYPK